RDPKRPRDGTLAEVWVSRQWRHFNHHGARRSHRVAPEGGTMATKITRDIVESYLNCKYKGHLKLAGENGTPSDYETMTTAARQASREQAVAGLVARFGEGDAGRGRTVTAASLRQGTPLLGDVALWDDGPSLPL